MDWKEKLNSLYDKNPELDRNDVYKEAETNNIIKPKAQTIRVEMEKRNGKPATILSGFEISDENLKDLAKKIKSICGSGGSARGGEILIQGDFRKKIAEILQEMGYKLKKINFN